MVAGLGPAITADRYQVGDDVADAARACFGADVDGIVRPDGTGRWTFDLWAANRRVLFEAGVSTRPTSRSAPSAPARARRSSATARPAPAAGSPPWPACSPDSLVGRMTSPTSHPGAAPGAAFRYEGYDVDPGTRPLTCRYSLDGRAFAEGVTFPGTGDRWDDPAVDAAARWVFLLAGVSYYKTGAPPRGRAAGDPAASRRRDFLRRRLPRRTGRVRLPQRPRPHRPAHRGPEMPAGDRGRSPAARTRASGRWSPSAAGIDSIVTVELVRPLADAALFVVSRPGDRFAAIERPAAVTGLPVVRAERAIDEQVLRSAELGFLNGHVPVTGILSAIGVMAAVLDGRDAVVMSNEWSSSVGNVDVGGRNVNHQWSKSLAFETGFRGVLAGSGPEAVDYFSRLRPYSELFIAERFAGLGDYHLAFQSCNRGFHIDPASASTTGAGAATSACFIDLILAPFLHADRLAAVFGGASRSPTSTCSLGSRRWSTRPAPSSRGSASARSTSAARRSPWPAAGPTADGTPVLRALVDQLGDRPHPRRRRGPRHPLGDHHIPDAYATSDLLV